MAFGLAVAGLGTFLVWSGVTGRSPRELLTGTPAGGPWVGGGTFPAVGGGTFTGGPWTGGGTFGPPAAAPSGRRPEPGVPR